MHKKLLKKSPKVISKRNADGHIGRICEWLDKETDNEILLCAWKLKKKRLLSLKRQTIIDFNVKKGSEKRGQDKLRGNSAALFEKIPKENLEQNCELKRENRKTTS